MFVFSLSSSCRVGVPGDLLILQGWCQSKSQPKYSQTLLRWVTAGYIPTIIIPKTLQCSSTEVRERWMHSQLPLHCGIKSTWHLALRLLTQLASEYLASRAVMKSSACPAHEARARWAHLLGTAAMTTMPTTGGRQRATVRTALAYTPPRRYLCRATLPSIHLPTLRANAAFCASVLTESGFACTMYALGRMVHMA